MGDSQLNNRSQSDRPKKNRSSEKGLPHTFRGWGFLGKNINKVHKEPKVKDDDSTPLDGMVWWAKCLWVVYLVLSITIMSSGIIYLKQLIW